MKGIELTLDGIKYFVTIEKKEVKFSTGKPLINLTLYLSTLRSESIYTETIQGTEMGFNRKHAKKFIERALAVTP